MPFKAQPSKIICVGLNYRDHVVELGMTIPDEPVLFLKPPSTIIGHGEKITLPDMSRQVEYEAELAIVIGQTAKDITSAQAASVIAGYTCANDVTARDLQKKDGQWTRAKSFDTFCPVGPRMVSDIDPGNLSISLTVNGAVKQESNTSQMIFNPFYLVRYISQVMTLNTGDIILTGTPPGVGQLKAGDEVSVTIEGIGTLTNFVL